MFLHFFILFAVSFIVSLCSDSMASFQFLLLGSSIGFFTIIAITPKHLQKDALKTYTICFSILCMFTIIHYLDIINDYSNFSNPYNDEFKFWNSTKNYKYTSIIDVFNTTVIQNVFLENPGYYFYIHLLGYVADTYSDGNHIMLQLCGSVVIASILSCFIYRIFSNYTNRHISTYTIIFICMTKILPESVVIHRDILIALLYAITFYCCLIVKRVIISIVLQIVLIIITINIRLEHGLFLIMFTITYLYYHNPKYKVFYLGLGILFFLFELSNILYLHSVLIDTQNTYTEITNDGLARSDGLGNLIHQLPIGLKQTALILQSQIHPFPAWAFLIESNTIWGILLNSTYLLSSSYWFFVFIISIYTMLTNYKQLPTMVRALMFVALIFFVLNTTNMGARRIMCVYPIIFIVYILSKNIIEPKKLLVFKNRYIAICFFLYFTYIIFKYKYLMF